MSQTTPAQRLKRTPEEVSEDLSRLRAEIRVDNPDMTEADWVAFADQLAAEIDDGLRERVRKSRGEAN